MMLRVKRAIGACILASALLPAIPVHAATYYVAPTGSNSNPGTEEQPWRTVAHAVNTMVAGDTTYVRGGTYIEGDMHFKRTGAPGAPIKLLAYPGEFPVIDCNRVGTRMIHMEHPTSTLIPMAWFVIEGFEIRNCYCGIKWSRLSDSIIRNNWIHHNKTQGILGYGGPRNIIDRNIINSNGTSSRLDHGIYASGAGMTITNNLIYDNTCFGIQHNGSKYYNPTKHPGRDYEESHNWIVAHNTIAYNRSCSGYVVWGANADNLRLENNIFYENRVKGAAGSNNAVHATASARGADGSTGILIRNNISYATGSGGDGFISSNLTGEVNYTQSGNIVNTLDPKFINAPATLPASPNFALTAQSPAIDAGLTITATKRDFLGAVRPQGRAHDIGAYEYKVGGDSQAPERVQNVQVR